MNETVKLRVTYKKVHLLLSSYFHWCLSTSISDVFGHIFVQSVLNIRKLIIRKLGTETRQFFKIIPGLYFSAAGNVSTVSTKLC